MKVPIIICDDNLNMSIRLEKMLLISQELLNENKYSNQVILDIYKAKSFEEAYEYVVKNHVIFGLYFLDIELNDGKNKKNGIDLAEQIKKIDNQAKIIFVTNYQELAYLTYKRRIGAVDYIIKTNGFDMQKRLNETLEKIMTNYTQSKRIEDTISYKLGTRVITLDFDKLLYIETAAVPHKLNIVKDNGISFISGNLKEFEENNSKLLRISQSCLINPKKVSQVDISKNEVIFLNGDTQKYSRKMRNYMKKWQNRI
ncbi:LytR/AlgR family response regulator transcription factor [Lactobacillus crispatus]|uniref:LytR/AlgR family response regulator transcription factor n=1 Tax=Lactobacillus crispatus TaxID=47770 RepID=UPI0018A926C0|nr:LytTR family DNA-binding domain-containing protein [Lactobacillus crispatus]